MEYFPGSALSSVESTTLVFAHSDAVNFGGGFSTLAIPLNKLHVCFNHFHLPRLRPQQYHRTHRGTCLDRIQTIPLGTRSPHQEVYLE